MATIISDVHHALHCEHGVDEVERHRQVIEDCPAGWVGAGESAGTGEAGGLQVAGDVVQPALTLAWPAAVSTGAT